MNVETGVPLDSGVAEVDSETGDSRPSDTDTGGDTHGDSDSAGVETGDTDTGELTVECDRTQKWTYVAAGMLQTCGVHADGCAECWGLGEEQRVDGGGGYGYYGEDRPPAGIYSRIEMYGAFGSWEGPLHTCGISEESGAHCWGSNAHGECDVTVSDSVDISVGEYLTYGLGLSGDVWGIGYRAELPPDGEYVDVAVGESAGYVRSADGTTLQWALHSTDPGLVTYLDDRYLQIDAKSYACGLREDGSVRCWSPEDPNGDLDSPLATDAPAGPFVSVCVKSPDNACALDALGAVTCWGSPSEYDDSPPMGVLFQQISCGSSHVCGVTTDNDLVCWGYDAYGETLTPT